MKTKPILPLLFFVLLLSRCTDPIHESMRQWSYSGLKSLAYEERLLEEAKPNIKEGQMAVLQAYAIYKAALEDLRSEMVKDGRLGIQELSDDQLDEKHTLTQDQLRLFKRYYETFERKYEQYMEEDISLNIKFLEDDLVVGERYSLAVVAEVELTHYAVQSFY